MKRKKQEKKTEIRYDSYEMKPVEEVVLFLFTGATILLFMFVFYNSFLPAILFFVPTWIFMKKGYCMYQLDRRKQRMKKDFLSALLLLRNFLQSGYSLENAIRKSLPELKSLHQKSEIYKEWVHMADLLDLSVPVESLFLDFSSRCPIEELRLFSEMLVVTKRTGGQVSDVLMKTASSISESFRVEEEVRTTLSGSVYEVRLMSLMPLLILLFVRISSFELLEVMYQTILGRIIMTLCLSLYLTAVIVSNRMVKV